MNEPWTLSDPAPTPTPGRADDPDPADVVLVVVGASLRAERWDRPLADHVVRRIEAWEGRPESGGPGPTPLACTDLWHVNHRELLARPALAIGHPDRNASTAWLGCRLPTVMVIEDRLRIQLDPEFVDRRACLWGVDQGATESAVDLFLERYLDGWMRAVVLD